MHINILINLAGVFPVFSKRGADSTSRRTRPHLLRLFLLRNASNLQFMVVRNVEPFCVVTNANKDIEILKPTRVCWRPVKLYHIMIYCVMLFASSRFHRLQILFYLG